jgi:hypothetical protein
MPATPSPFIDKKRLIGAAHFHYGSPTGLLTGVAAGTASAGHVYALRNPSSAKKLYISRVRLAFIPTTAFGAAQALSFALFKLTGYSAAHTGGNAVTPQKRLTSSSKATVATARIGDTGALTAGTHTLVATPIFRCGSSHATLPVMDAVYEPRDDHPIILEANEGLLVRNEILMGASGVGVLIVEPEGWER